MIAFFVLIIKNSFFFVNTAKFSQCTSSQRKLDFPARNKVQEWNVREIEAHFLEKIKKNTNKICEKLFLFAFWITKEHANFK